MKYKAPAGGFISGNIFYPGGSMLPLEATGQSPHKMAADEEPSARRNPLVGRSFIFEGMKQSKPSEVKKFDAANEDSPPEGPSAGVTGYGFSSPNTKPMGEVQFPDARRAIGEGDQKRHVKDVEDTLVNHGIPMGAYKVYNSIGDWGTGGGYGAENIAVHVIQHPTDWKTLRKVAAKIGHIKKQLSVLAFQPEKNGKSLLHRLYIPNDFSIDQIRGELERQGIYHRTIAPAPNGAHVVFVVEPEKFYDPATAGRLDDIAQNMGGHLVDRAHGRSSFVGQEGHDGESEWTYEHHSKPEYEAIMGGH